jgi:hypothetical protein
MADYDNSHSVILFKNERKTEDWHAEYEGTWTGDNGEEFYATCKIKEGKKGKFLLVKRGKLKTKGPTAGTSVGKPAQSLYDDPLSDDIPF